MLPLNFAEKMFIIPEDLFWVPHKVSASNISNKGKHVETLGFLLGFKSDDNLIGTDLIFPQQDATCGHVDDKGKYL